MKTALITGASGGIGKAAARRLSRDGFRVVIHYLSARGEAEALARELNGSGGGERAEIRRADVSDRKEVRAMFEAVGDVDVLVNNAGISQQRLFTDITPEEWRRMFAVNVDGVFHCCQFALPGMIHKKRGKIINVSSMWGQTGASCETHYSASKAAVIGLTKALAKELGPSNIQVNCICPGVIRTPMNGSFPKDVIGELEEETPLGRLGEPEEVAAAVGFLASPESDFITGQVLGVNGGFVI